MRPTRHKLETSSVHKKCVPSWVKTLRYRLYVTEFPAQRLHRVATTGDRCRVRNRWRCTWASARGIAKRGRCVRRRRRGDHARHGNRGALIVAQIGRNVGGVRCNRASILRPTRKQRRNTRRALNTRNVFGRGLTLQSLKLSITTVR